MSDHEHHPGAEETAPLAGESPAGPPPGPPPGPPSSRSRWRDRSWPLPTVVAVALVAVLLGGLGGAALASVGDHQDRRGPGFGRFPGHGPGMMPPGRRGLGQGPGWRFDDPYGQGQRQWDQRRWDLRHRPGSPQQPPPSDAPTPPPPSPSR